VTDAHTKTATKMANPSIQALDWSAELAVLTSRIIDKMAASSRILRVKSYSASQNNSKSPGGYMIDLLFVP
jgi:hypothetical protein